MSDPSRPERLVEVDFDPFAGAPIATVIPTTEAQREVWLADQLDRQASLAFNESITLALTGALDLAALETAIRALLDRHDILRGALSADGTELLIQESVGFTLPVTDLRDLPAAQAEERMSKLIHREVTEPFDLVNGPLIRGRVIHLASDAFALVLTAHHIVCDGFSFGVLLNELAPLYRAAVHDTDAGLSPADSFADYAARLASQSDTQTQQDAGYWIDQYRTGIPVLDLPTRQARPASRSFASSRFDTALPADTVRDIRKLAADSKTGAFAVLLTAFSTMLARIAGTREVVVGVPSAGQSVVESTSLVGHCVNLLPMRVSLELDQSVRHNLTRVQDTIFGAFDHQRYTYGTLLKKLPVKRDPSRPTLVSVMFNLDQALEGSSLDFGPVRAELVSNPRAAENFELFLNVSQTRDHMVFECQYNTDLFDESTIRHWLNGLKAMLVQMTGSADQPLGILDILGTRQAQMLKRLNQTRQTIPDWPNLGAWLTSAASGNAERVALRTQRAGGELESLSYATLDALSNQLAHALRARGVRRGSRIGICLPRTSQLIIAQWAALKSGAAYVPLDPGYPEQRLALMADDAGLELIISDTATTVAGALGVEQRLLVDANDNEVAGMPTRALPAGDDDAARPDDPAYLIYTSGSTGKPKGVRVQHRAVINFLASMTREPGIEPGDRLLAVTTLSFDIAVLELLLPMVNGAQVVLASTETTRDGAALAALIGTANISMLQATPSTWRLLLESGFKGSATLKALVGGEPLPADLAANLLRRCRSVWNLYGPTETTIWSSLWRVARPGNGIRIGRPIANTHIHVLDDRAQPCPIGVPGEIVIGGAGVTLGYHNRALLNTERFMPDPFSDDPGARMYRTGDLGRWTSAGELEHLGRIDDQVKVRGFRIELGEIEACLAEHPAVAAAVVGTHERRAGDVRLIAWIVPAATTTPETASGATASTNADAGAGTDSDPGSGAAVLPVAATRAAALPDPEMLRHHLRGFLPDYMVPQHFTAIERIPMTANGKIDRRALAVAEVVGDTPRAQYTAPRNDTERVVVSTIEQLLDLDQVDLEDDFFSIGGHSLLAARLVAQLNQKLDITLPMRVIFESPTPSQMAARIDQLVGADADDSMQLPVVHVADQGSGPLTPMQQRVRFIEQMMPGRPLYNVPSAHRLTGSMDLARFRRAVEHVVARQSSLRTILAERDGQVLQIVRDDVPVDMPVIDLTDVPRERQDARLQRALNALIAEPIDIEQGPLFRCAMFRLAADEHVFFFMAHHAVWDGWSFDLLYDEMAGFYAALGNDQQTANDDDAALPPLPATYIDFSHWQQQWLQSDAGKAEIDFWLQRIMAQPRPERLPSDLPRGNSRTGNGATVWINVSDVLAQRLRDLSAQTGTTLNMVLLAAYSLMMSDMATDKQIVVGMPLRGRPRPEFENVMGFFNNLLPLHLKPHLDWSFVEWLNHVRRETIELLAHQDIPFERLASEVTGPNPLDYQILFSFQDARERVTHWGDLEHRNIQVFQRGATEDLGLWLIDSREGLSGGITYNADLFTRETAEAIRRRFSNLLKTIAKYPELTILRILPRMHGEYGRWALQGTAAVTPGGASLEGPEANAQRAPRAHTARKPGGADTSTVGNRHAPPVANDAPRIDFDPVDGDFADTAPLDDTRDDERSRRASARQTSDASRQSPALRNNGTEPHLNPAQNLAGTAAAAGQGIGEETSADQLWRNTGEPGIDSLGDPLAHWSDAEKKLAAIWSQVLGNDDIDLSDNFFDLGGTSLQAMQVVDRLERLNGLRVNPRLLVFGSLRQLALSYLGEEAEREVMNATLESVDTDIASPDTVFGVDPPPAPAPSSGSGSGGFLGRLFGRGSRRP